MTYSKEDLLRLPLAEKIALVEDLWDSIDEQQLVTPLPNWKKDLIKNRIASDKENPTAGTNWEVLRNKYVK